MHLIPKTTAMNYIVGKPLGAGGFATVYSGVRRKDGMLVAMKFIDKSTLQNNFVWSTRCRRFVPFEIHLLEKANNIPGVIRVIDWYETWQHFVIVMERRDTLITLQEYLETKGFLCENEARDITRQLTFTIENLMRVGVFHRDLKPSNILLDIETRETKIIDFGCGDIFCKGQYTTFCGTAAFMPPEWFRVGSYGAEEATVWSLGLVLLIMLTGTEPFPTQKDIAACHLYKVVPVFLSQSCKNFIFHCMASEPSRRCKLHEIISHRFLLC